MFGSFAQVKKKKKEVFLFEQKKCGSKSRSSDVAIHFDKNNSKDILFPLKILDSH